MQQPDVRIGLLDDLAFQLQHQAQHAVRSRMLRTEVQREIADLSHVATPVAATSAPTGTSFSALS